MSELAAPLLTKVLDALGAGKTEEAVRAFLHATASNALPGGVSLRPWLLQAIGWKAATRLAQAFAVQPCFYCEQGSRPCAACAGTGRVADRGARERCAGLGHVPCQFCNSSGWAPVDLVPPGLRLDVTVAQVRLATAHVKRLLAAETPGGGSTGWRCWPAISRPVRPAKAVFSAPRILFSAAFRRGCCWPSSRPAG